MSKSKFLADDLVDEVEDDEMIPEMDYLISISSKSKQISSPIGDHHVPVLRKIRRFLKEKKNEL